jgi:hypothetical protein
VNVTPLEPEWEGQVTIEISNTTPLPARIYANEGICQFLFLKGDTPPEVSYADRSGKYMRQRGVRAPEALGRRRRWTASASRWPAARRRHPGRRRQERGAALDGGRAAPRRPACAC